MSTWTIWTLLLVQFFFFPLISTLKGRTKSIALWIYLWCMAGVVAFGAWRTYQGYRHWLLEDPGNIYGQAHVFLDWAGFEFSVAILLVILPVAWYRIDLRREKIEGDKSLAVSPSENPT